MRVPMLGPSNDVSADSYSPQSCWHADGRIIDYLGVLVSQESSRNVELDTLTASAYPMRELFLAVLVGIKSGKDFHRMCLDQLEECPQDDLSNLIESYQSTS